MIPLRIVEKTYINRPVAQVWPFLIQPELFVKWNPKVVQMEAKDRFVLGQVFVTHYKLKRKASQVSSRVTELKEFELLEIFHENPLGEIEAGQASAVERFELKESGGRTTVIKTVTLRDTRIPVWIFPLIWFVTRFGKRTGPDLLQQMCESLPR